MAPREERRGIHTVMILYHSRSIDLLTMMEELEDRDVRVLRLYIMNRWVRCQSRLAHWMKSTRLCECEGIIPGGAVQGM